MPDEKRRWLQPADPLASTPQYKFLATPLHAHAPLRKIILDKPLLEWDYAFNEFMNL